MLYTLLTLVVTILLLTLAVSYMILHAAIPEKPLRRLLLLFVLFTPFIAVYAFIKSLFCPPQPVRFNAELGQIEDEIESERAKLFGGAIMRPSFSDRWNASYLYAVKKSARAAAKYDPMIDPSLAHILRS